MAPSRAVLDILSDVTEEPKVVVRTVRKMWNAGHSPGAISRYLTTVGVIATDDMVRRWCREHA